MFCNFEIVFLKRLMNEIIKKNCVFIFDYCFSELILLFLWVDKCDGGRGGVFFYLYLLVDGCV